MDLLLPGGIAAASLGLTYLMCIRPMRNGGHCAMVPAAKATCRNSDEESEIVALRTEIDALRQELPAPQRLSTPPTGT